MEPTSGCENQSRYLSTGRSVGEGQGSSLRVITTSVIRSTHKGQSHGGVYLVDMTSGTTEQVIDWDTMDIDWAGRGLDRGLRGIAFHEGLTYIAASDEILAFDRSFQVVEGFRNPYLRHCHEIDIAGDVLWMSSTGFDSLLALDLRRRRFCVGICLRLSPLQRAVNRIVPLLIPRPQPFDPNAPGGPEAGDTIHLNTVVARGGALFCSGTGLGWMLGIDTGRPRRHARVPRYTHNCQPYNDGVVMNYTAGNVVRYTTRSGRVREQWPVVRYDEARLINSDLPKDHARQGFARGLCTTDDGSIIVGSSPATISLYRRGDPRPATSINLTMDVRNAVHGLELYPY